MPLFLFVFGAGLAALACLGWPWAGILLWPAESALLLSALYALNRPAGFFKRADGRLPAAAWAAHLPFLVFRHAVALAQIRLLPEPACQEVAPGLWIARRLRPEELPADLRLATLVDLTAEFSEPRGIAALAKWRWIPILDAGVPDASAKRKLEELAREWRASGEPVLVHCAQGHGRSATAAAFLLVASGRAPDVAAALAQIQAVRPGARPRRNQRKWLEREFKKA